MDHPRFLGPRPRPYDEARSCLFLRKSSAGRATSIRAAVPSGNSGAVEPDDAVKEMAPSVATVKMMVHPFLHWLALVNDPDWMKNVPESSGSHRFR